MITTEIKAFFEQVPIMALATVDKKGIPNVSAIASKKIIDKNTIWTIDTFHKKTLENIEQNGNIALAMWKDGIGYQIKGKAKHYTEGEIYEKGKTWILTLKPQKIVKGVIEIKVSEIFYLTPDYKLAGEKVNLENSF
jgi:predicted pyridoxine 5'-phosphate oxidase superfamily flavin-nucleotide-binding protein